MYMESDSGAWEIQPVDFGRKWLPWNVVGMVSKKASMMLFGCDCTNWRSANLIVRLRDLALSLTVKAPANDT